ncbi:MAP kinase phosphatase 5 [Monoraphidium neglectum]|uniref:protein-tyrosine-phosphatase n=1 Tax=Monoraphidium neglectum TaxID=145388 RepID=A0A0D2MZ70_9CHLO|nr:MAP kinase phosphatase 5 [Monoraphidium neglectum]KIZ07690.1 MAP kinase phosphatase 5 [Monoraphidium neglectum]|eukprot:XP_013906709.1 MAP kinase phosphatase 5 [Monoraphidium neglectum]
MAAAKAVDAGALFRVFTACPNDPRVLILDVRPLKQFKRGHVLHSFCVRLSADGRALLDYSQASYDVTWSQDCWWGRPVIAYGPAGLSKEHPVLAFLSKEGRCASLGYFKDGFEALEAKHPYLVTASVKQGCIKHICTIHNHPENLVVPPGIKQLRLELPDVEGADISQHFNPAYEFLSEGARLKEPALVHCGAGVSRSAALVAMFLMRSTPGVTARAALDRVRAARSMVLPNDGFWRVLCALEAGLGVPQQDRSDPNATTGFAGADAPVVELAKDAAGERVADAVAAAAAAAAARGQKGWLLVFGVSKPEGPVGKVVLGPVGPHQRIVFGRAPAPACDVTLEHLSVSRQHAALTVDGAGGVLVTDLGSAHGTRLGDTWIKAQVQRGVPQGGVLRFGASTRAYTLERIEKVA